MKMVYKGRKIIMLEDDTRLGFKEGEIYGVESYRFDSEKFVAVPLDGKEPFFTCYKETKGQDWDWLKES